ncbi:MAG: Rap1a/Tai family immunity protein [Pseudomonadota bacterium]
MRTVVPIALAALIAGSPAKAAEPETFMIDTATDLARLCAIAPDHPNYMPAIHFCHGYLIGMHHFQAALAAELAEPFYCAETAQPQPTRNTAAADFSAWVAANPKAAEMEALDALITWAIAAYPCS